MSILCGDMDRIVTILWVNLIDDTLIGKCEFLKGGRGKRRGARRREGAVVDGKTKSFERVTY